MAKVNQDWRILRHGPIDKLESNLCCVTGSLPGMSLKRVMTLVRLGDGRIVIHSAVALDDHAMAETPDLVRIIVSHHLPITDEPAETLQRVAATV